jgi:hypothetical protein
MERNGIYIIDLQKTVKKLDEAYNFVRDTAAEGGTILFVGTKKQAQDAIKEEAERAGMFYVNARWLGGCSPTSRPCAPGSIVWPSCARCSRTAPLTSSRRKLSS